MYSQNNEQMLDVLPKERKNITEIKYLRSLLTDTNDIDKEITARINTDSKHPIRTKPVTGNQILNQSGHFNYQGCYFSFKSDTDWEDKLAKLEDA